MYVHASNVWKLISQIYGYKRLYILSVVKFFLIGAHTQAERIKFLNMSGSGIVVINDLTM